MQTKRLIDVYPYRFSGGKAEFLLLKRAGGKIYEGQWRMIGGKVHPGETFWQAALRELQEETQFKPVKFWSIPSLNQFYEPATDQVHQIPAFGAEISTGDEVVLDDEHSEAEWFPADRATSLILWPEQQRLLTIAHQIITKGTIPEEWVIPVKEGFGK